MENQEIKEKAAETAEVEEKAAAAAETEEKEEKVKEEPVDLSDLPPIVAKKVMMPMSRFGIGPVFGAIAIALTVLGIFLRKRWIFASGIPSSNVLRYIYLGLGIVLCLAGLLIYVEAVFGVRIDSYIKANKLCTEGVYAWTRNPIYTGILFVCTGALFISGNVYMYVIPIFLWGLLTILLKKKEEPVLIQRFDQEFVDYMVSVNRVLPKPPAKKD